MVSSRELDVGSITVRGRGLLGPTGSPCGGQPLLGRPDDHVSGHGTYPTRWPHYSIESQRGHRNNRFCGRKFSQQLENGDVSAYTRVWGRQPLNGDGVQILAYDFNEAGATAAFLAALNASQAKEPGASFAVPGIAGAFGYKTTGQFGGYTVTFAKGNTAFVVGVLSTSGDLTQADAIALATRQAANAPDNTAANCPCAYQTKTDWWRVSSLGIGALLTVTVFVIGRKRKYPTALSGLPSSALPLGTENPGWVTNGSSWHEERPKVGADRWP